MTAYSMTITNSVNIFGIAPSDLWNVYNWGEFLWGEGTTDLITRTTKVLGNTITGDTTLSKSTYHLISNAITSTGDMGAEYVRDSAGYYHVYPDRTTDLEGRDTPTWSAGSSNTPTWTSSTASAASWS